MNIRTDLVKENTEIGSLPSNEIEVNEINKDNINIQTVIIKNENAAEKLLKPIGKYITLEFERLDKLADTSAVEKALIESLQELLPPNVNNVLVVGLGNRDITPDAIGPITADMILATRHLSEKFKSDFGLQNLKKVSSIIPGVLGKTGIEASVTTHAAVKEILPEAVIVVDALAAGNAKRLCSTIQLNNTGISPGSGVNNSRKELSQKTLGVPVISIGVPTVVDADSCISGGDNMMVTPKEIDILVQKAGEIISIAINLCLQKDIDEQIIRSLV